MTARRLAQVRRLAADVVRGFGEHDLLSYASAIAFQVLFALVPAGLAGLAVLGWLGLGEVWSQEVAPTAREQLPSDAFSLLDRTVDEVLSDRRLLWLTFGVALALWELSGAIRTVSGPVNLVNGREDDRSWGRRFITSMALAAGVGPLLLLALLTVTVGDNVAAGLDVEILGGALLLVARWLLAILLLGASVFLVMRFAAAGGRDTRWVSVGSAATVGGWVVVSLAYGWYLDAVADYSTVFAGLAFVIVLMTYLYVLAVVFLGGAHLDASLRRLRTR